MSSKNTQKNSVELTAAILSSDSKKADQIFERIVSEKYQEAINSKKKAVAQSLYGDKE
jgi:DNA polymerase III delta subunit